MLKDSEALLGSERDKERLISDQERKGRKCLGKDPATKSDNFLEKFQTAFDPPPFIFVKLCCKFYNGYGRIYTRRHRPDSIR